jgi:hypothetical protein
MTAARLILLAAPLVVLTACGGHTSSWESDNPTIREIQKAETARHIADSEVKEVIKRYLGARVRIVFSGDIRDRSQRLPPAGRAAALTRVNMERKTEDHGTH